MNQYLKIFILSLVYYVLFLFVTLQAIPFIHSLLYPNELVQISKITIKVGPIPVGYVLMLLFAAITIFALDEIKERRKWSIPN